MRVFYAKFRAALVRLRNSGDIGDEIEDMRGEREVMKAEVKTSLGTMLNTPLLRWALTISVLMMISQQITGINAVRLLLLMLLKHCSCLSEPGFISALRRLCTILRRLSARPA